MNNDVVRACPPISTAEAYEQLGKALKRRFDLPGITRSINFRLLVVHSTQHFALENIGDHISTAVSMRWTRAVRRVRDVKA